MWKWLFGIVLVLLLAFITLAFIATRDGQVVTPEGAGRLTIDAGSFEAFPLPDYAAKHVTSDYKSYFVEVEPGIKIHILETGTGFPVYMQHGNPTSGFLYRKIAAALPKDRVRLIMPTMVGLGFSSKIPASAHTLENHLRWMNIAIDRIIAEPVVYVGQDWGGPVGMGALARSPDKLAGVVALNTGFTAPQEQRALSAVHARVKTPILGELLLEVFVSVFDQLHQVQGDPASIPAEIGALYGRPVLESGNAKAPLALMRMVPDGPDHPSAEQMREIEAYVGTLEVPAEIVWGMQDPILGEGLAQMQASFPNAAALETSGGHFLQEEVPEEIAAAILRVVDAIEAARAADAIEPGPDSSASDDAE